MCVTAQSVSPGEPAPEVSPRAFRHAVGQFATGIAVVTTRMDGVDHAMTVNALTSVSLDPLLVLACFEKISRFHDAVLDSKLWAVSVLGESGHQASVWFSTRGRPLENQIGGFEHIRGEYTDAVIFTDALASLECRTHAVYDGGDHTIVVGEVLSVAQLRSDEGPLIYYGGSYRGLGGGG
jgi:flavin reductase (DIM6/NTAB) family NADH-FMN oxidoreductase RutF